MGLTVERRGELLESFEHRTEIPLLIAAVLLIPLVVVPIFVKLPPAGEVAFLVLDVLIWLAFAVEYGVRLYLTPEKWRFVRHEWADLLIIVIPVLRPLRLARSARLFRILRLGRLVAVLGRVEKGAREVLTRHGLHYALIAIGIVVLAGAAVVEAVEPEQGSFDHYGDAAWWALTTVTTGAAYRDSLPATSAGKVVAGILTLAGLVLLGVLTANLAAFIVERPEKARGDPKMDEIIQRLDAIERRLSGDQDD
jgi:voltage-gated potassium channel